MIVHVVLFKWKEDTTPEAIRSTMEGLKELKAKIPGIIDLSCGENFSERSQGFQHGLVVKFTDKSALEAYTPHPDHQAVVQNLIKPILADILAVDYEV
ncbi:MAG: Dabb family protein [Limnoraphis robusta]|uniref:Dabb family protein n=1 Tax=Limnoraphis robusta CCNP1315 TaxID=3110306 RepID=A0ABU5TVV0_9CYAN|nr:Dabb family protein [Limnoraphis robusta]MEA5519025.1 Dabb family protein [Limnoraphis robusta CCNP1315]MEA5544125.1 Dabb family protein [Limnoraphis robusta CCNP1324]